MFKLLLNAIVIVPVLLGILAARTGRRRQGPPRVIAFTLVFCVLYQVLMYFLHFRWGS